MQGPGAQRATASIAVRTAAAKIAKVGAPSEGAIAISGGCQGCAASSVTLRQGFEVMVRRMAPEIVDIVDTTDHAAGQKPFYQRTV